MSGCEDRVGSQNTNFTYAALWDVFAWLTGLRGVSLWRHSGVVTDDCFPAEQLLTYQEWMSTMHFIPP